MSARRTPAALAVRVGLVALAAAVMTALLAAVVPVAASAQEGSVRAVRGDGQSAAAGTQFAERLRVQVRDAAGNPVFADYVRFRVTGGSASFDESGSGFPGEPYERTNSDGEATAPMLNAGPDPGPVTITATAQSFNSTTNTVTFRLTVTPAVVESITAVSGGGQTTTAGQPFGAPLVAEVRDSAGRPASGAPVRFTASSNAVSFGDGGPNDLVTTGVDGRAESTVPLAGRDAGPVTVVASTPGTSTQARYDLSVTPASPGAIRAVSGSGQSTTAGRAFADPLVAEVRSTVDRPTAGAPVTFMVTAGSASFPGGAASAAATTGPDGRATSPVVTAGPDAGPVTVTASTAGVSATASYRLSVTPAPAGSVTAVSGGGQSVTAGQPFPAPLVARVRDALDRPLAGAPVTFTVSSGSAAFAGSSPSATATTGPDGQATSPPLTAGATAGPVTVTATTPGVTGSAGYTLTVTAATPPPTGTGADLAATLAVPGSVAPGSTVPITLTVSNRGPAAAQAVASGINLPTGLTVASGGGGAVDRDRRNVGFLAATIPAGRSVTYTVTVTVARTARGALAVNGGVVSARTQDPNYADNAQRRTTTVSAAPTVTAR